MEAPFPEAPVAEAVALLAAEDAEDAALLAAPEAEVKNEEAAEVALLMALFSALEALARMLLISLEMLLCADGEAVAATEERLAATEEAEAEMDETWDSTDVIRELTSDGTAVPRDDANDSAEEIAELISVVALPKAEVASLAMEVATDTIELTAELISDWATAPTAKARTTGLEKCMLQG